MAKVYENLGRGDETLSVVKDANADMSQVEIVDFSVLSKIDGVHTIEELIAVVGLPEDQVIRSLQKFKRLGMVRTNAPNTPHTPPRSRSVLRPTSQTARPVSRQTTSDRTVKVAAERKKNPSRRSGPSRQPITRPARHRPQQRPAPSDKSGSTSNMGVRPQRALQREEKKKSPKNSRSTIRVPFPENWPIPFDQFMFDPVELETEVDLSMEKRKQVIYYQYHLQKVTYYDLFQVDRNVPDKDLRKIYFKLSKEFHPDLFFRKNLGPYKKKIEEIFRWMSTAYAVLTDPHKKASYDGCLAQGYLGDWDPRKKSLEEQNKKQMQRNAPRVSEAQQRARLDNIRRVAEQAEQAGDWRRAFRYYKSVLDKSATTALLAHRAARCLLELEEDLDEAEGLCLHALGFLADRSQRANTIFTLAQVMELNLRWADALRLYKEVCQLEPDNLAARMQIDLIQQKHWIPG